MPPPFVTGDAHVPPAWTPPALFLLIGASGIWFQTFLTRGEQKTKVFPKRKPALSGFFASDAIEK
jgi:hypothetical protein